MSSPRIGHTERVQALESLTTAYAEGGLDETEFEDRAGRALRARTQDELGRLLVDLPVPEAVAAVGRSASVWERIGDCLVHALRCVVLCWLPPSHAGPRERWRLVSSAGQPRPSSASASSTPRWKVGYA
ncbi:DUF1707 domain-containing protein [Streptomyces sp. NPDC046237]|uniref:DUF1707 SHOCT-like domain-containing protein n=1 Tax=Streptomyces sp. NPDC046237 TaxID=3154914 RepID=UPI003411231E